MRTALILLVVLGFATSAVPTRADDEVSPWTRLLIDATEGCDRLRVRTGGTCHRNQVNEQTLHVEEGAEAVSAFLDLVRIDDKGSGFHCMCCGSPTLELYRDDKLVVSVGFHHGRSLRWPGGPWGGDALLEPQSQLAVSRWVAKRGATGPLVELEEALAAALRRTVDDLEERLRLALQLYGCHAGTWSHMNGFDGALNSILEGTPPARLAAVLAAVGDDEALIAGLARFLYNDRAPTGEVRTAYVQALPAIGRSGLTSPRGENRRRALAGIARAGGKGSVDLLRAVLAGTLPPRPLDPIEIVEPGGWVVYTGMDEEVREPESDRVVAAFLLAKMGDLGSLPQILALAAGEVAEQDRAVLDRALALLGG